MADEAIEVVVLNREQEIFRGKVKTLTSVNSKGEFDILPKHQNFISLIRNKIILRPVSGEPVSIPVERGILHVLRDQVKVFLGIGK